MATGGERDYAGRRVLVTGGAGAIGSNLTRELLGRGAEVVVLDNMSSGYRWNLPDDPALLLVEGDLLDENALKRVFGERPAVVFHLAAFFANQRSVDYPELDLQTNGVGMLRLLEYGVLVGTERIVYTSSSSVYGDSPQVPVEETAVSLRLNTPYQITKLLGEMYADFFHRHHGLKAATVRLFNSYGPGEVPGQYRNVVPNFFYWAMSGRPLPITGTGDETREFTFVGDVARAIADCGVHDQALGEVMNIAGGAEVPIKQIAESINALVGSSAGVVYRPGRRWDTKKRLQASTERARACIGFEPAVTIDKGLVATFEWFRTNWDDVCRAASFPPGASASIPR